MNFQQHTEAVSELASLIKRHSHGHEELKERREATNRALIELFHELCGHAEVEILIECGAHAAEASTRFVQADQGRRAVALEANPYTFTQVTKHAEAPNVAVLNLAVGAQKGQLEMQIRINSSDEPSTAGATSFLTHKQDGERRLRETTCEVTTLDALVADFAICETVALWIDVEGMVGPVIEGGVDLLRSGKVRLMMVETETKPLWDGQILFAELCSLLEPLGLVPIARDCQMGDTQFNVIFGHDLPAPAEAAAVGFHAALSSMAEELQLRDSRSARVRFMDRARSVWQPAR